MDIKKWLEGKKTYIVAIVAIVAVAGAWATGQQTAEAAVTEIVGLILAMTFRGAVAK